MANTTGKKWGGRKKGTANKINAELKDMIREALDVTGGVEYLVEQSKSSPAAFLSLIGKILPKDINVGGQENNPIKTRMEIVIIEPDGTRTSL